MMRKAARAAAIAQVNKAIILAQQGKTADAIAAYDAVVQQFAGAQEPAIQEQVAKALLQKGFTVHPQEHA